MTDQELADRVVALGVGFEHHSSVAHRYLTPLKDARIAAQFFVRDWRVAGSLIEKCLEQDIEPDEPTEEAIDESVPRAIIEACVGALE